MPKSNVKAGDKQVGAVEDKSPTRNEGIHSPHPYEDVVLRRAIDRLCDGADQNVGSALLGCPRFERGSFRKHQFAGIDIATTVTVGDDDGITGGVG